MNSAPQDVPLASTDMTDRLADLMERREERWLSVEHPENGRCVALSFAVTSFDKWSFRKGEDVNNTAEVEAILARADAFLAWLKNEMPMNVRENVSV